MNYKLNLPKTTFPMCANLPKLEPKILDQLEHARVYDKIMRLDKERTRRFVLHDGPPYANGHVHLGTAMNKILKDFVVKSRSMMGYYTPYMPGWDCHGMPIEHNVVKELGDKAGSMSKLDIRKHCRFYAEKFFSIQRDEFKRLGCFGTWSNPYLTMNRQYEADVLAILGNLVKQGYIYRGKRPIHWCSTCCTALAEAELEYRELTSPSIYVKFAVQPCDPKLEALMNKLGVDLTGASILIWTTTPWTIPANLAIALHPEFEYVFVRCGDILILVADALRSTVTRALGWKDAYIVGDKFQGKILEGMLCSHPLYKRDSIVILAEYVSLDTGTGCVHIAPGHGADDFESGKKYGLDTLSPVDNKGCFTGLVPDYEGMHVFEADELICTHLEQKGALLAQGKVTHTYPFCWRCGKPLIFRATPQWFINVDANNLRKNVLQEIERVTWIPKWSKARIFNMLAIRPDWCISRQRAWGVPIPAVYCAACGHAILSNDVIEKVVQRVAKDGSDVWFSEPISSFIPTSFTCPKCGSANFTKENDILDVWFDSSVSWFSVLEKNPELDLPCELYLEASDQHRGFFQVSLLTSVAIRAKAPFKQVLTHGLILDENAKKMSKSLGNAVTPNQVIDKYGADVLRLFIASQDYTSDIRFSWNMLLPIQDAYRKIRNTLRFILGNLVDFDPQKHTISECKMVEVDQWLCARMREVVRRVKQAYLAYEFHTVYRVLLDLCIVDMSAFYMDVVKDRLYAHAQDDLRRRSAQSALYQSGVELVSMLVPILSFTAEEVWSHLPADPAQSQFAHLASFPDKQVNKTDDILLKRWVYFRTLRSEVNKALESARKQGRVKDTLGAELWFSLTADDREFLASFKPNLQDLFKVADVHLEGVQCDKHVFVSNVIKDFRVRVEPSLWGKCARCWNRRPEVSNIPEAIKLCSRCESIMNRKF